MMHHATELELQAYADNELSAAESGRIAQILKDDPEALVVFEEIKFAKSLLAVGELEATTPASRQFYWSKIERAIASKNSDIRANSLNPFKRPWLRFGLPAAAAALIILLIALLNRPSVEPPAVAGYFHEIDAPLAEEDAISFHSESAAMTIVWVDSRGY
ncbi:MAG: hypothetical protein O2960_00950 [Verrucomicrobia bacterium]|nr:hypothetical protein [Verrucomicrobiota bacterium]